MNSDSDSNRTVDFILFSFYVDDIRICRAKVVASNSVKENTVTNNNNTDKKAIKSKNGSFVTMHCTKQTRKKNVLNDRERVTSDICVKCVQIFVKPCVEYIKIPHVKCVV